MLSACVAIDELVRVDQFFFIGRGTPGFKSVMEAFNRARPILAARGVGPAQGTMARAIEFIRNRRTFHQQVRNFQGGRWLFADMAKQP